MKPLDHLQLQAWHSYLDWEIAELNKDTSQSSQGKKKKRALVLNLIPVHEHRTVRPLIEAQQSSTEESEPTAQPQEPLEEVTGPRDDHRVRVLFERCLIACALYEEFWSRVNIITNAKNT